MEYRVIQHVSYRQMLQQYLSINKDLLVSVSFVNVHLLCTLNSTLLQYYVILHSWKILMDVIFKTSKYSMPFWKLKFWKVCFTKSSSSACIHFKNKIFKISHEQKILQLFIFKKFQLSIYIKIICSIELCTNVTNTV